MAADVAHYPRYRFPPAIINHAVWLHYRFTLSFRDVEHLLRRVPARLAVLALHQVEHLVLTVQHQVVQPEEDPRPAGER